MSMQFQMNEITQITEVTRDRLKQWLKLGWIIPSVKKASGPGSRNIFNLNDLYRIAIFKVLPKIKAGFIGKLLQSSLMQSRIKISMNLLQLVSIKNCLFSNWNLCRNSSQTNTLKGYTRRPRERPTW